VRRRVLTIGGNDNTEFLSNQRGYGAPLALQKRHDETAAGIAAELIDHWAAGADVPRCLLTLQESA
jgi:hypothetical protein